VHSSQKTSDDDEEHGPVEAVDCTKWQDQTKPEGVAYNSAAAERSND